ncbi:MAG: cupin domain-containing protein [Betaproteobacteria bacterium]|nr:cupin domain-containing protein [Betaproteobacteria bacterium]
MNGPDHALVQRGTRSSPYALRARYFSGDNGFLFRWPDVPVRQFLSERTTAYDPNSPTGLIPLDNADRLGTAFPATTPVLLLRYLRICAGESLRTNFAASGEVAYVISGHGESSNGGDAIEWKTGDLFLFPGGRETLHRSFDDDCLLFVGTDEPLLAYDGLRPPAPGQAAVTATHWLAEEIERRLEAEWARPAAELATGRFVQFSSDALAPSNNTLPFVSVAINSLEPGGDQQPHRHNGVAVTLALEGSGVHSLIDGQRVDWSTGAAQITPPASLHSHHNRGGKYMRSLIFQDEALHYYTRTPGFSFE